MRHVLLLEDLNCAHCASKIETKIAQTEGYNNVSFNFATKKLQFESANNDPVADIQAICDSIEDGVHVVRFEDNRGFCLCAGACRSHYIRRFAQEKRKTAATAAGRRKSAAMAAGSARASAAAAASATSDSAATAAAANSAASVAAASEH